MCRISEFYSQQKKMITGCGTTGLKTEQCSSPHMLCWLRSANRHSWSYLLCDTNNIKSCFLAVWSKCRCSVYTQRTLGPRTVTTSACFTPSHTMLLEIRHRPHERVFSWVNECTFRMNLFVILNSLVNLSFLIMFTINKFLTTDELFHWLKPDRHSHWPSFVW